jgi:2-polyprenyl-6-methoxyphenol hydroxylase-like FAD-dependent oxidoreductase
MILIVGAGPTGLTLACELAVRGVPFRLVDQAPVRSDKSRALVVHARTLEVFQKMGIADALIRAGRTAMNVSLWVAGREAMHLSIGDTGVDDTPSRSCRSSRRRRPNGSSTSAWPRWAAASSAPCRSPRCATRPTA